MTVTRQSSIPPATRRPSSSPPASRRRQIGVALGAIGAAFVLLVVVVGSGEHLRAPGSMNVGHEGLACDDCHRPAPGSVRQQLQANARYLLGLREEPADFGNRRVRSGDCLQCHVRPADRHPVFRFNEPRFADARRDVGANECTSCHAEHSGGRVTVAGTYCSHCHGKLSLENEPLDVSHAELARQERWDSCLECHDFHGNHAHQSPTRFEDRISERAVTEYLNGGRDPYGRTIAEPPRKHRADVVD